MWLKNLQVYRLPVPYALTAEALEAFLEPQRFVSPPASSTLAQGWIPPRDGGPLVHVVQGQYLIALRSEKKLLPASVVNEEAKNRAAVMEEEQGFAPGKRAMKDLKERITDEFTPRAFPIGSVTRVWMDPVNGWLVVDSATASKADDVIKLLLKAIDTFPLSSFRVQRSPVAVMTAWLETDEAPAGFTVDQDAEMVSTGESKASIAYKKHTLDPDDLRRHIAAGKQCTRLALTWNDKVSFVLTESLAIKKVAALDILKENVPLGRDEVERFDGDFLLMAGELNLMLADLAEALGGFADEQKDIVDEQNKAAPAPARQAAEALQSEWPFPDPTAPAQADQAPKKWPKRAPKIDYSKLPKIEGTVPPEVAPHEGWVRVIREKCTFCRGTGRDKDKEKCVYCEGKGKRRTADWHSPEAAAALVDAKEGIIFAGDVK